MLVNKNRKGKQGISGSKSSMRLVSVKMPEALLDGIDTLVKEGYYPNRSAVIRTALRDLLKMELGSALGKYEDKSRKLRPGSPKDESGSKEV